MIVFQLIFLLQQERMKERDWTLDLNNIFMQSYNNCIHLFVLLICVIGNLAV